MKPCFISILMLLLGLTALSQTVINLNDLAVEKSNENITVEKLYSDELVSSFVIWVKKGVNPHFHATHTEQVLVISGKGKMRIEEEIRTIKKGDLIIMPKGTVHAVEVTSRKPLKVLSIQAPEFKGDDRVFID